jgi:tetratricopeptide (TPR) repeat protein
MNSQQDLFQKTTTALDQCLAEVRFARAAELGRAGQYDDAEALLSKDGLPPEAPRELDLLARIAAQQGRLERARRLWETALQNDPQNQIYRDCLECLSNLQNESEPANRRRIQVVFCAATVFVLILAGLAFLKLLPQLRSEHSVSSPLSTSSAQAIKETKPNSSLQSQPPAAELQPKTINPNPKTDSVAPESASVSLDLSAALAPVQTELARLQRTQEQQANASTASLQALETNQAMLLQQLNSAAERISSLSDSVQALTIQQRNGQHLLEETRSNVKSLVDAYATAKAATNPPAPLKRKVAFDPQIKGVTVKLEDDRWLIRFDSGIFDRDDHFKLGSKALLDAIAKSLVQTQEKLDVEIIGYAEQEPATWPWSTPKSDAQLALDRAERVKNYLRNLRIFPPAKLTAISGLPDERPFPRLSKNNRTVVLRVSRE